jgi:hypothetical protein
MTTVDGTFQIFCSVVAVFNVWLTLFHRLHLALMRFK